jgi:DNA-binding IclR family transcriptional regulator
MSNNSGRASQIASISKVLQILECFSITQTELSAPQIAREVKLPTSTLYRYLQTMTNEGFLTHNRDRNTYTLGLYVIELGGIALTRFEVRRLGQRELNDLALRLNMNTNMGILYNGDLFHLAFSARVATQPWHDIIGRRSPAHQTAMGKVLLSYQPFEEVRRMIEARGWQLRTPHSIDNFDELARQLEAARKNQYAVDIQEYSDGCCLACPVRQRDGTVIAAISVSTASNTPYQEFEARKNEIIKEVFQSAAAISYRLGYLGDDYLSVPTVP